MTRLANFVCISRGNGSPPEVPRFSLDEVLGEAEDDEEEAAQEAAALEAELKAVKTIAKEAKKVKEAVAKAYKIKDKAKVDE